LTGDRSLRPDPEVLLRQYEADVRAQQRGKLKVFLGYASGVGKSFRMLDEGRRRSERGQDVVVAAVQPVVTPDIEPVLARLEVIPLKQAGGAAVIDIDRVLKRRPGVCLVDGLAYENPPGARNRHRWQDVNQLLNAGISVITSVNIQYIEELRAETSRYTGKRVTQTVPVSFIQEADEIVVVDAPATPERGESGKEALREMALLLAADVVDRQLESYLAGQGLQGLWGRQERILVCITPRADAERMIASGRRNADRFHGELHVVYVRQPNLSSQDQAGLARNLEFAAAASASVAVLDSEEPVEAILEFATRHGITQIFIGHSLRGGWWHRFWGGPVDRLIRRAEGIDIQVFPHGI